MRTIAVVIFITFYLVPNTYCQSFDDTILQAQSYIFEHFVDGSVLQKSGEIDKASLNYCAHDQTILFKKEGTIFTLTGLSAIDTIYIKDRKFVPVNNAVYEALTHTGKVDLYISYVSKMSHLVAAADISGTSQKNPNQVNNTLTDVYISRPYKGEYAIEIVKHYWLKNFKNLYRVKNEKDFLKIFKEGTVPSVKDYLKQNHIDFNNEADLVKLLNFSNQL